ASPIAQEDQRVGLKGFEAFPPATEQSESPIEAVPHPAALGSTQKSESVGAPGPALPKASPFLALPNDDRTRYLESNSLLKRSRNGLVRPNINNLELEPAIESAPFKETVKHSIDGPTKVSVTAERSDKEPAERPNATTHRKFFDSDSSTPRAAAA